MYSTTSGEASIAGYSVKTQIDKIYHSIGICPQFDILVLNYINIQWDDLTIGEHLYFYARLKGIPSGQLKEHVREALENVSLLEFENRLSKWLSGGEKRRLSIAIALLGSPSVIFLDEPTVI